MQALYIKAGSSALIQPNLLSQANWVGSMPDVKQ